MSIPYKLYVPNTFSSTITMDFILKANIDPTCRVPRQSYVALSRVTNIIYMQFILHMVSMKHY